MTIRVGITGGMGSGKSTVASVFSVLGIPVYHADEAAKRLMNEDPTLKASIMRVFGDDLYADGKLNRSLLAGKVFNNPSQLALLNSMVHPATIAAGEEWMRKQTSAYAIKEAAILFESGSQRYLDWVIGVYAPVSLRILRSMKRNNQSREDVMARMEQQMDDRIKMKLCDTVIINDEQKAVMPQVLAIHEQLLSGSLISRIR